MQTPEANSVIHSGGRLRALVSGARDGSVIELVAHPLVLEPSAKKANWVTLAVLADGCAHEEENLNPCALAYRIDGKFVNDPLISFTVISEDASET